MLRPSVLRQTLIPMSRLHAGNVSGGYPECMSFSPRAHLNMAPVAAEVTDRVIISNNRDFMDLPAFEWAMDIQPDPGPLWTDDFSSLFSVIRRD